MSYGYSIEPVPSESRRYDFIDNFSIWFGVGISIAEFWAGAILAAPPVSLTLKEALLAIIAGHVLGNLLLSLIGVVGVETGLPTMVIARRPLGLRGSHLVSALNYLQLIGWTAVMLIVGGRAMNTVSLSVFGVEAYWVWVLLLGVVVTFWSVVGPEKWSIMERLSAVLLVVLTGWLTYVVFERYGFWEWFKGPLSFSHSFWLALDLVVAMPVSWAPLIADYTRFSKNTRGAFWGSYTGYFAASSLFYFLGAYSNIVLGEMDPISVIAFYGLGIPAMLIIIFSTVTTTFLDVYSAAITYKNMAPRADVRKHIVIAGALGTLLALVFPMEEYEWFLLLIGGSFVSLTGVMIADYVLERSEYRDPLKVMNPGVNVKWGALVVWSTGFTLYMLLSAPILLGVHVPFFSDLGSRIGSSMPTLIVVFIAYIVYNRLARGGRA
ncbi:MAG: putative hydroxymethylpyrimidine transporter CytX [Desulfurococcus sp.]|nr:putative hydroxymethylpyrimidine transporter CytX [Desulfurococcus sp.]